jgi:hypothetical protein
MEKLFKGKEKYATKGIAQKLPLNIQLFLWSCIEKSVSGDKVMDYLQVFRLQNICDPVMTENRMTRIVHSQEIPEYESTYILSDGSSPVEGTIFVVDDGNVVTMLWADEY